MEISLEKVDQVKERTGSSYKEAKEALEICNGDVLEAIIYLESKSNNEKINNDEEAQSKTSESIDEFKVWLKELIKKGNVSRIKIKKDETVLVDVPVNAGIAAGVIAVILPPVLAFGVIAAVATKITIEITKVDGSVEVVNKYISKAANEVKDKATIFASSIKNKIKEVQKEDNNSTVYNEKPEKDSDKVYSYTVNFDEEDKENN